MTQCSAGKDISKKTFPGQGGILGLGFFQPSPEREALESPRHSTISELGQLYGWRCVRLPFFSLHLSSHWWPDQEPVLFLGPQPSAAPTLVLRIIDSPSGTLGRHPRFQSIQLHLLTEKEREALRTGATCTRSHSKSGAGLPSPDDAEKGSQMRIS